MERGRRGVLSCVSAIPNFTPSSTSTDAGERESGGPVRTDFFSKESGAARIAVSITGIFAATSSFAACLSC